MLVESFVASTGFTPDKPSNDNAKGDGVFIYDYLPVVQQKVGLKKSTTSANCIAVSQSHIFAAQADKAVVNVYNREKGSQEAIVPFTEKVTCIALACDDTVLVLGTAEGRLFLWEVCSGRQITTSQSHLQAVTDLVIDSASTHVVSISSDTSAHVWSLVKLLAFQNATNSISPTHTFTGHRAAIKVVALGHSTNFQNFAITASEDKTCLIWDLYSGSLLVTILLSSVPVCLLVESADRAAYVGYDDGSLQQIRLLDLMPSGFGIQDASKPVQLGDKKRWKIPGNSCGSLLCMDISFDATSILTGHHSGAILTWDVANGHVRPLPLHPPITKPLTNITMLPVAGFHKSTTRPFNTTTIAKPRFGAFQSSGINVSGDYAVRLQVTANKMNTQKDFQTALTSSTIPLKWLENGLHELENWSSVGKQASSLNENAMDGEDSDYMALDNDSSRTEIEQQNAELRAQLASLRNVQMTTLDQIEKLSMENQAFRQLEQQRLRQVNTLNGSTLRDTEKDQDIG